MKIDLIIKESIHSKATTILNSQACNNTALKYLRQKLSELKGDTTNPRYSEVDTSLSRANNRPKKISKEREDLNNIINKRANGQTQNTMFPFTQCSETGQLMLRTMTVATFGEGKKAHRCWK